MWRKCCLVMSVLAACSPSGNKGFTNDPRETLKRYIEKSFSIKSVSERRELEDFLTGDAKARLASWSPGQFEDAFLKSKKQFSKLSFSDLKAVSPTEAHLTYDLSFDEESGGVRTKVTNKKACQMTLRDGNWFIRECKNIKQLVEYTDELSIP